MKEFHSDQSEQFQRGLRPQDTDRVDAGFLLTCTGMRPINTGLASPRFVTRYTHAAADAWPFPQMFQGSNGTKYVRPTRIGPIDETDIDFDSFYVVRDGQTTYATIAAKVFSLVGPSTFIDFERNWFIINKKVMFFSIPAFGSSNMAVDHFVVRAGCRFDNRLVLAGMDNRDGETALFSTTDWLKVWNQWLIHTDEPTYSSQVISNNFVMWGPRFGGDSDFPFTTQLAWLGSPNSAAFDALYTNIVDDVRKGEMGFHQVNWKGPIYAVKPLGSGLMVYGATGVSVLVPSNEEQFSLGEFILSRVGVPGPGAVVGDEQQHFFLDNDGGLSVINAEFSLQRLGYEEFLQPIIPDSDADEAIVLSQDPKFKSVYISGGSSLAYVLHEGGLSKLLQPSSSLIMAGSELAGTAVDAEEELLDDGDFEADTGWIFDANWTIAAGVATWTPVTSVNNLVQDISHTLNRPYRVAYTVGSLSGSVGSLVQNASPQVYVTMGGHRGALRTEAGDYTDVLFPTTTAPFTFVPERSTSGTLTSMSIESSRRVEIVTGATDLGQQALKTITAIEIQSSGIEAMHVALRWRNGTNEDFRTSTFKRVNKDGFVFPVITCREFSIEIRGYRFDNQPDGIAVSKIEGVDVRYKIVDNRWRRGATG